MSEMNSFSGLVLSFANTSIHFAVDEVMKFRAQLTRRTEFQSMSGWGDDLNKYMKDELEKIYHTLTRITINPSDKTQEELEGEVSNTETTLAGRFNSKSVRADDVIGPAPLPRTLEYDFTGNDPNYPQVTLQEFPNEVARNFIRLLDRYVVELTRLDSNRQYAMITKYDSLKLASGFLDPLWTICMVKGGEA